MQRLQESAALNGPLCAGLDTDPSYLPEKLLKAFGDEREAVLTCNKEIVRRIAADGLACCFKIQIAYYEAMGMDGLRVYAETLRAAKETGLPVIADVKRGDIASTAAAYARAHFSGDFEVDAITVNPYMGFDTLEPFAEWCAPQKGKGFFALLSTSNPGASDIQALALESGGAVRDRVAAALNSLADRFDAMYEGETCSPIGAVVGCSRVEGARKIREALPRVFFLIPGYGAQGGDAKTCAALLSKAGGVVNSSRGIICAWKKDKSLESERESGAISVADIARAAEAAAESAKSELLAALSQESRG